jgi:UDP-glucose 4-epimerase
VHVLVTGGAGYIGSYVTRALLAYGHRVTVVDDLSDGYADSVPSEARLLRLDASNLPRGMIAEAVIHLAGRIAVGDAARAHWIHNVGTTLRLLEHVRAGRFIFASSAAVYGDAGRHASIEEQFSLQPLGAYGQTKVAIEQMLAAFGGEWTALRLFNVAGGRERHKNETHLLPLALRGAVTVFGSNAYVRDYVHVEDVADAFACALTAPPGIYNVGTGVGTSVQEMIDCVERVTGKSIAVFNGPPRTGDPYALVANIDRARNELGWKPRRSLVEIVRSAAADIG